MHPRHLHFTAHYAQALPLLFSDHNTASRDRSECGSQDHSTLRDKCIDFVIGIQLPLIIKLQKAITLMLHNESFLDINLVAWSFWNPRHHNPVQLIANHLAFSVSLRGMANQVWLKKPPNMTVFMWSYNAMNSSVSKNLTDIEVRVVQCLCRTGEVRLNGTAKLSFPPWSSFTESQSIIWPSLTFLYQGKRPLSLLKWGLLSIRILAAPRPARSRLKQTLTLMWDDVQRYRQRLAKFYLTLSTRHNQREDLETISYSSQLQGKSEITIHRSPFASLPSQDTCPPQLTKFLERL